MTSLWKIDLYKWLDLFNYFPYKGLPADGIARLWLCLFHGVSEFLLHDSKVFTNIQIQLVLK